MRDNQLLREKVFQWNQYKFLSYSKCVWNILYQRFKPENNSNISRMGSWRCCPIRIGVTVCLLKSYHTKEMSPWKTCRDISALMKVRLTDWLTDLLTYWLNDKMFQTSKIWRNTTASSSGAASSTEWWARVYTRYVYVRQSVSQSVRQSVSQSVIAGRVHANCFVGWSMSRLILKWITFANEWRTMLKS